MKPSLASSPGALVLLVVVLVWLKLGGGPTSSRRDAARYGRDVVAPIAQVLADIEDLDHSLGSTQPDVRPTEEQLAYVSEQLLPAYRKVLSRAEQFQPKTPAVAEIHQKLIAVYSAAVRETETFIHATQTRDDAALFHARNALWALDFAGVDRDLNRLCEVYQVDPITTNAH